MKRPSFIWLATILLLISSCRESSKDKQGALTTVSAIKPTTISAPYQYEAWVAPVQSRELAFNTAGTIYELNISEGQTVEKGTVLATIKAEAIKNQYDSLRKLHNTTKLKLNRYAKLLQINDLTQKEYDQALKAHNTIKEQYDEAAEKYHTTQLVAPFSGQIEAIHIQANQPIESGQAILKLTDPQQLHIQFTALKEDVNLIRNSDSLIFRPDNDERIKLTIKVTEVTAVQENHFRFTAAFDETLYQMHQDKVTNGTSGRVVDFGHGEQTQLVIPESAIIIDSASQETSVWVVNPHTKTISKRQVTTGVEYKDGQIVIRMGLKANEIIATSKVETLKEGQKVKLRKK